MPTARAYTFIVAAFIIYLFANQTQVGWLYVVAALLLGLVLAGWWLNRAALKGMAGERRVGDGLGVDLYEGDETHVSLSLKKTTGMTAAHVKLEEYCPLAAPDSPQWRNRLFIPALPPGGDVEFQYDLTLYRRGLHEFPPLHMESSAPFGFFRRTGQLTIPTRVLIYPEVRPLQRLELLDRKLTAQVARPRAGVGYEVMGVRPYRVGDSPRHVHWRSVAKTGVLFSKEFADEAQPGLTLVMDLFAHPYRPADTKHTPFEWAVKAAASIGDYARRRGYSLYLMSDDEALAAPVGAVSWMALLQYLARAQPTGKRPLGQVIGRQPTQNFVAVILPWPDETAVGRLVELQQSGVEVLAVVIDPATFPQSSVSAAGLAADLRGQGVAVQELRFADDWSTQLSGLQVTR